MKKENLIGIMLVLCLILSFSLVKSISPSGADTTVGTSETAPADAPETVQAQAGNVTQINIYGYSTTQTWQGYFGNVSGTLELADASNNTFYNWSLAQPEGEVYASINSSVNWPSIQCFNFTASGAGGAENPGETNLGGKNVTTLETEFGIAQDDVDGVNETFSFPANGHDQFFTGNLQFSEGECPSTKVFSQGGAVDDQFEQALLYEPNTGSVVFAAILEPESVTGFNGLDNDFQMLVLENGHGGDTDTTTYYFFVEIE